MTIMSRHLQAGAVAVILDTVPLIAPVTAFAQGVSPNEIRSMNDQVAQVQRELNVLQRHVYQGNIELAQASGGNIADMQVRIEDLESRMRDMNGRMEELNHRLTVLNDRLDKFSSDMEFRLNSAPPAGGAAAPSQTGAATGSAPPSPSYASPGLPPAQTQTPPPSAADPSRPPSQSGFLGTLRPGDVPPPAATQAAPPAPQPTPAAGKALPDGTPEEQYKYAFALLTKSDYPGAERALQAFVQANPKHQLAGNAQYWLGETFYVRNDFNNAVRAFATGIQNYRTSPKAPDSVLKLGLSLSALGKTKEACTSYTMLKNEYPKAPQEIVRRAESEQKRLRCG
jgi:tol-pal system protein YbgF